MLKKIGTGAALLVAITASGTFLVARAAPERRPGGNAPLTRIAGGKLFAPVCKANGADARSDPAWVGASFAHDNCWAPRIPAPVDGFRASRDQVMAGMEATKSYIALSDVFQRCIRDFVAAGKTQADTDKKPMDMALVIIENHRISASQRNKNKVANQIKMAINDFNEYGSECPD